MQLTKREKADRFDALQAAMSLAIERYEDRRTESINAFRGTDPISSFNRGAQHAYEQILEDLRRWTQ